MNDIVFLAKNGDKNAFGELYALYYTEMYKYALYMLKSPEDAKDAVSEAVCSAYQNIKNLKDYTSFKPWLFKILYRKIIAKTKVTIYANLDEIISDAKTDIIDLSIDLKQALSTLDIIDRSIVLLTVCHNYNSTELSDMLNINSQTVRSKRSRAMKKLREVLAV